MRQKKTEVISSVVLRDIVRGGVVESSRLQLPSLILLVLSLGDIFVTFTLLSTGQGYYESNPVAQWFLAHWNFKGMFLFKLGMIAGTITLGEVIERHRPGLGRFVLWLGCLATSAAPLARLETLPGLARPTFPGSSLTSSPHLVNLAAICRDDAQPLLPAQENPQTRREAAQRTR